ncbi:hypothetical protein SAMN05661096_02013 [Marivirga sericea]|uniref:Uncharacterized protein n=1 Tax=Marivirga sericea TaxID=1028 RepID=A0A1X7JSR8_9BACT|nr:hypothetical protein [Marivirga sericea]SMG30843.1 hypothetical protein SAMN05661096_02013 [Marivirga sericea]
MVVKLIVLYGIFKLFVRIGYNEKVYSALGAVVFAFTASFLISIMGWYIAIDLSSIIVGAVLGSLYGTIFFPTYIKPIKKEELTH